MVGTLFLVLQGARPRLWWALGEEGWQKLTLIAKVGVRIADHPWLGGGRDAFESAFAPYAHRSAQDRFRYAENLLAQCTAERGFPITLLVPMAFGFSLWRAVLASHGAGMAARRRSKTPARFTRPRGIELGQLAKALDKVGPTSDAKLDVRARWLTLDSRAEEADRFLEQR